MEKTLLEQKVEKAKELANDLSKYPREVVADALHMLGIGKLDERPIQITIPKEIICSTSEFIRRKSLNFLEGAWEDYRKLILNHMLSEYDIRRGGLYGYVNEPYFSPTRNFRNQRDYSLDIGIRITNGKEIEYINLLKRIGHKLPYDQDSCDEDFWSKAKEEHNTFKEKTRQLLFNMVSDVFCMTDEQRNQKIMERELEGNSLFRMGQTVTVNGGFPSHNYFSGPRSGFLVDETYVERGKAMLRVIHKGIEPLDVSAADVWEMSPLIELQRPLEEK